MSVKGNVNGCDSTAVLTLTINNSDTSYTNITACDTYTWDGVAYTSSGAYTNTYTNAAGCDSVHTLNLTINNSTTSTVTQTACDSYTWNGTTYTSSGSYTYSTTNANGCDSTATLNLTINSSTTSTTTHTACDSYTWNGTTYTSSGSYTYSTTNANGCDSTAVLNLTINSSDTSYTNITACDSYTWNDSTYTQTGTYSYNKVSNNYSIDNSSTGSSIQFTTNNYSNTSNFTWLISYKHVQFNTSSEYIIDSRNGSSTHGVFLNVYNTLIEYGYGNNINSTSFNFTNGNWKYAALINENNYLKLMIDGVILDSISSSGFVFNPSHTLGNRYNTNNHTFTGYFDNFSIWNIALNQIDIQNYINCPPTGDESGLVDIGISKKEVVQLFMTKLLMVMMEQ